MPKDGFNFRSGKVISQQGVDFAAEEHFRSPFRSYEMRRGAAKWHSCAKGWFRSCETTCEMGLWLRKLDF